MVGKRSTGLLFRNAAAASNRCAWLRSQLGDLPLPIRSLDCFTTNRAALMGLGELRQLVPTNLPFLD
jgi:hypothetical protein